MEEVRLQKYLANQGVCSRRKAEEYILEGFVEVNGKVVKELGTKIDPKKDKVLFKGNKIDKIEDKIYILLNKLILCTFIFYLINLYFAYLYSIQ